MKILIADDDAVSRTMMRRMLMQSGYEVLTASDGDEAARILTQEDGPRLALLDWMMPGLDGPSVCRAVRACARRAYIYTVLLTSKDTKEDLLTGLGAGADDYLTKPCNPLELKARLTTGERILNLEDHLIEAREEMRFKATHDSLTELFDRGAIMAQLAAEVAKLTSPEKEFSTILCDVDHFKKINDTYGHPVGDEILREVGRRLKIAVREADVVGRYGGEEFLLLLDGCGAGSLSAGADRICRAVSSKPFHTSVGLIQVTISAGALHVGQQGAPHTVENILQKVDAALYRAKEEGRDRFVATGFGPTLLVAS
ncbi:GGDEF domain-containing response regulator [Granulicella sibirica]|uniref:diguanylate cyclase n=1 Tax=Granulicella sibirica TaxID=2479048 RepID=A0A4Q0SU90_9BACT|nr:diguanylate cyclase [Granulicella sibirica]RXH54267.1 diguanylate cyclase/phosphodiesterase (GGDEF & EAL domains) with PAS/PAC sensor(s) [Granulicella sibirica]